MPDTTAPALQLDGIVLRRDDTTILDDVSLSVRGGERWLLLGPNGCGKTSLIRIAALYDHPTAGTVDVLGQRLGRVDIRRLRRRIGLVSAALSDQFRPALRTLDVVRTARYAALEPWWHTYTAADDRRAAECLERMGIGGHGEQPYGTLSSGERTRTLLARALFNDPAVLLLDEPSAGLDLAGREELVATLDDLAADPSAPPFVVVTHHVEDIPTGLTHALMLRDGTVHASGRFDELLTAENLSSCFGVDVQLDRRPDGRLSAWSPRLR